MRGKRERLLQILSSEDNGHFNMHDDSLKSLIEEAQVELPKSTLLKSPAQQISSKVQAKLSQLKHDIVILSTLNQQFNTHGHFKEDTENFKKAKNLLYQDIELLEDLKTEVEVLRDNLYKKKEEFIDSY